MVFNKNIPQPGDLLSQSQADLLANNIALDASFDVNHYTFSNLTANNGKHKFVVMPTTTAPATIASEGAIYIKTDSAGQQALWFIRDGFAASDTQLTNSKILAPTVAANGVTFLPGAGAAGGLLFQWGSQAIAANPTSTQINFPQAFTSAAQVYSITVSRITADVSSTAQEVRVVSGSVTASKFNVITSSSSGANVIYWMAIGS